MYLYGASGHAKVIIDILEANGITVDGVIDDNPKVTEIQGYSVKHEYNGQVPLLISIGANMVRARIVEKVGDVDFGKAIHPSAIVSERCRIDEGTVVMQGCILQSGVRVGKHCIINTGASIDHECELGDFVHVSPHCTLCGNVRVGEGSWVGAGSTVIPGVRIGKWSVVGAGSVVTRDIPDNVIAYGNPCKIVRLNNMWGNK